MTDGQTDRQTDICDSRVAFATEKHILNGLLENVKIVVQTLIFACNYFLLVKTFVALLDCLQSSPASGLRLGLGLVWSGLAICLSVGNTHNSIYNLGLN